MPTKPGHIQIEHDKINSVVVLIQQGDGMKGVRHGHDIVPHPM